MNRQLFILLLSFFMAFLPFEESHANAGKDSLQLELVGKWRSGKTKLNRLRSNRKVHIGLTDGRSFTNVALSFPDTNHVAFDSLMVSLEEVGYVTGKSRPSATIRITVLIFLVMLIGFYYIVAFTLYALIFVLTVLFGGETEVPPSVFFIFLLSFVPLSIIFRRHKFSREEGWGFRIVKKNKRFTFAKKSSPVTKAEKPMTSGTWR